MESAEKLILGVVGIIMFFVVMTTLGSCGGGMSDDLARHAIDRASLVRVVDDIANGGN